MAMVEPGQLVIIDCTAPREKLWGVLLRLDRLGPVVRSLNLDTFEDWLRQERDETERFIMPSTVFVPMHRVERIYLDESSPLSRSFDARYREACHRDPCEALTAEVSPPGPASGE